MSAVATAIVGTAVVGAYVQSEAADKAADAQKDASKKGVKEQQRQFDAIKELLKPYVDAGTGALTEQQNLVGLNGNAQQQAAIDAIKQSSQFGELNAAGQDAILQNASATGGLRGGNVQAALAQFSPQLLNQILNQQYNKLGGLTSIGQNAAAGQGNAGMQVANNVANLYGQAGQAEAGNALAQGKIQSNLIGSFGNAFGNYMGGKF